MKDNGQSNQNTPACRLSDRLNGHFQTDGLETCPWLKWYDNLITHAARMIPAYVLDRIGPDDMVQETMLAATMNAGQLNGKTENEILGWLVVTLHNRTKYAIRQMKSTIKDRPKTLRENQANENLWENIAADESGMDSRLTRQEHLQTLRVALDQLPEDVKSILKWRYYESRKFGWIAYEMQISERHARRRFQSAVGQFRREFLKALKTGNA